MKHLFPCSEPSQGPLSRSLSAFFTHILPEAAHPSLILSCLVTSSHPRHPGVSCWQSICLSLTDGILPLTSPRLAIISVLSQGKFTGNPSPSTVHGSSGWQPTYIGWMNEYGCIPTLIWVPISLTLNDPVARSVPQLQPAHLGLDSSRSRAMRHRFKAQRKVRWEGEDSQWRICHTADCGLCLLKILGKRYRWATQDYLTKGRGSWGIYTPSFLRHFPGAAPGRCEIPALLALSLVARERLQAWNYKCWWWEMWQCAPRWQGH